MEGMTAQVLEELGQHLEDADRYGAEYARRYVESIVSGGSPPSNRRLHPCIAKLVREVALDAQVQARWLGRAA